MKELRFTDWRDFQSVCRFWMQRLVQRGDQPPTKFTVYGNDGEGQGGVDLIPDDPGLGVVGQSKCWNTKTLYWSDIQKELEKTNEFPGLIRGYVILTTASRHTSVQQHMPGDKCSYKGRNGEFQVRIFYWEDLQSLDFIPLMELQRIWPRLFPATVRPTPTGPSPADHIQSLLFARTFLPTLITREHLDWLARWDYDLGYVPAKYFDLFLDLRVDLSRVQRGMQSSELRDWLNEGYRAQLSQCLPAATPIFNAIENFTQAVSGETVSGNMPDGSKVYGHRHDDAGASARISRNWKIHAEALLAAYREVVDGVPVNY